MLLGYSVAALWYIVIYASILMFYNCNGIVATTPIRKILIKQLLKIIFLFSFSLAEVILLFITCAF